MMAYNTDTPANQRAVRVVTAGAMVAALATDDVLLINKTTGSPTGVNLLASAPVGQRITIKDGKGDAATNNITLTPATGTIDGQPNYVMKNAYESIDLVENGTEWSIV